MIHRINAYRFWLCLTTLNLLQACETPYSEDDFETITTSQAIRHGTPDEDDTYRAVMGIAIKTRDKAVIYCSGVLVDTHKVLTAAHCVSPNDHLPFDELLAQGAIQVIAQYRDMESVDKKLQTRFYPVDDIQIHAGFDAETHIHDIAIIGIASNSDTSPFIPYPIAYDPAILSSAIRGETPIAYVGYGNDESDASGLRKFCVSKADSHCPMSSLACPKTSAKTSYIIPGGSVFDIIDGCAPCFGDSGGPALIDVEGVAHVFAVTSFGDDMCEDFTASTTTCEHDAWLKERLTSKSHASCSSSPRQAPVDPRRLVLIANLFLVALGLSRFMPINWNRP